MTAERGEGTEAAAEPATPASAQRQDLRGLRWTALLTLAATLALLWLDPFGLDGATERYSRHVFYQIAAPAYPDRGQQRTAVVLVTDATVKELGEFWPLDYTTHAILLQAILAQRPAALMIDFFILEERPGTDTLRDLLRKNRGGDDIPVLVAAPPFDPRLQREILEPLRDLVHGLVAVGRSDPSPESQSYPRRSPAGPEGRDLPTAAFALAERLCRGSEARDWCPTNLRPFPPERDLEVVWGARQPDYGAIAGLPAGTPFTYIYDCRSLPQSLFARFRLSLLGGRDALRSDCPYSPTIEAHDVLFEQGDPLVEGILRDRVVFYGGQLAGLPDFVLPPTHDLLPGVHIHAMAFDNLVTFGGDYIAREPIFSAGSLPHFLGRHRDEIVAVLVALLLYLQRYGEFRLSGQAGGAPASGGRLLSLLDQRFGLGRGTLFTLLRAAGWSLLILAVTLFWTWLTYSVFRMAPMNWLGISSVPVVVTISLGLRQMAAAPRALPKEESAT